MESADWRSLWNGTLFYRVFQSQECQEIPAWHGVRFRKVGQCQGHRALHGFRV